MANITGRVRDIFNTARGASSPLSWIWMNDGYAPAVSGSLGIIQDEGMIPVGGGTSAVPGTDTKWILNHATNGTVTAYELLATTPSTGRLKTLDECSAGTLATCTIEEWATDAGDMDGVSINTGQTMDIQINAKRDLSTSEDAHLTLKFYHRTTGGTETLLDTVELADLTTSYVSLTSTWTVSSDRAFGTNELLVVKIILNNDGTPV